MNEPDPIEDVPQELKDAMHSMLSQWMKMCADSPEFVAQFDRLRGTNIQRKGTPLELAIDDATGRFEADSKKFAKFCFDMFLRLPPITTP